MLADICKSTGGISPVFMEELLRSGSSFQFAKIRTFRLGCAVRRSKRFSDGVIQQIAMWYAINNENHWFDPGLLTHCNRLEFRSIKFIRV